MNTHDTLHPELQEFLATCDALEAGKIRVATPNHRSDSPNKEPEEAPIESWTVHPEIKATILKGFRHGQLAPMHEGNFHFWEKDTFPLQTFSAEDRVRIVPGGTSIRRGAYLAPGVIVMPPSYINVGAYIDSDTLVDSHVLVGSCAQIGKRVHLSAGVQIGGVLEPVGAQPVIIEDDVFVGGNCGIFEGVRVCQGAVLGSGVILNAATALYDATTGNYIRPDANGCLTVPRHAVVVAGSRPLQQGPGAAAGIHVYTPVLIKYRDEKTDRSLVLEDLLR